MNDKAEDLAYGHWPEILQHAGIDASFFTGLHGPCPLCGGRDRYRWSKKDGGLWVCNHCTEGRWGNGFKLLMRHMNDCSFRDAADFVRAYFNGSAGTGIRRAAPRAAPRRAEIDVERNLRRMNGIWGATRPVTDGDPVDLYLQNRVPGLNFRAEMIRFHPALDYWAPPGNLNGTPELIGRYPAMVSKAFDINGNFVQLHKTYLTPDGRKADVPVVKKTERGVGVNGFAVPVMPVNGDTIGFAEGIESALAASMFRGIPVWPCLNGPSMAAFGVPERLLAQVTRVVIFADHDERKPIACSAGVPLRLRSAGSHYAEQLADRARRQGKRVIVAKASRAGFDMADYWLASRRKAEKRELETT